MWPTLITSILPSLLDKISPDPARRLVPGAARIDKGATPLNSLGQCDN